MIMDRVEESASQKTHDAFFKFLNSRNGYYVSGPKMRKLSCCIYIYANREEYIEKTFYINENREKSFLKNLFERFLMFSPKSKPYRNEVKIFIKLHNKRMETIDLN